MVEERDGTFRVRRKLRTLRVALPFLTSRSLPSCRLFRSPFCILGRHCSVAREYAVHLKARKAIVAVERRAKKNLLSRSRDASPCILALYSRSALNPSRRRVGFDKQVLSRRRRSADPGIERFEESGRIHFIFQEKFKSQNLNVLSAKNRGFYQKKKIGKTYFPCNTI